MGRETARRGACQLAVELDVEADHVGNIDALIGFANGRRCPVEIKSWRSSRYRVKFNAALRQTRRQRDAVLAQNAVLWLPEAKIRNAGYQRDIVVVQGGEHLLIECLRKLKYLFVVQFPNPPPWLVREKLRSLGFHFGAANAGRDGVGMRRSIRFGATCRPPAGRSPCLN